MVYFCYSSSLNVCVKVLRAQMISTVLIRATNGSKA